MKYNLTFWQRVELFFIWPIWFLHTSPTRKTWHEVKKGMEKHKCNFVNEFYYKGSRFLACDHEGCNIVHDPYVDTL